MSSPNRVPVREEEAEIVDLSKQGQDGADVEPAPEPTQGLVQVAEYTIYPEGYEEGASGMESSVEEIWVVLV